MLQCSILSFFLFFPLSSLACPIYRARGWPEFYCSSGGIRLRRLLLLRAFDTCSAACVRGKKVGSAENFPLRFVIFALRARIWTLRIDCNRRENWERVTCAVSWFRACVCCVMLRPRFSATGWWFGKYCIARSSESWNVGLFFFGCNIVGRFLVFIGHGEIFCS